MKISLLIVSEYSSTEFRPVASDIFVVGRFDEIMDLGQARSQTFRQGGS